MNAKDAKDYLHLIQALADGETIQCKGSLYDQWADIENLNGSIPASHYRVKPEPREWTASVVTKKSQENGYFNKEDIGLLVGHDREDADDGYEIVRVREILD